MKVFQVVVLTLLSGLAHNAYAQTSPAPPPASASKQTCPLPQSAPPSDADAALNQGKFADAERLYTAMPASSAATAGIIRAQLGEKKLADALTLILKETAAHPNDPLLMDVLGEVRFRRGEVEDAAVAFNRSSSLDPCLARTHYDVGRYMNLNGLYASAQRQLDVAHRLAPNDPMITRAWDNTQRVLLTPDQQVDRLKKREEKDSLTDEEKTALENTIKRIQARQKGDCELVEPVTSTKVPLEPLGNALASRGSSGAGLDVYLNGKRRRFKLDTGASGLSISKEAARALGLTEEAQVNYSGIGDNGASNAFVSHVDEVKIGGMAFHNCLVRVFEAKDVLRGLDGLIGADVFRSFLVTLDIPSAEMRLGPLPKRPDEAEQTVSLGTDGDEAPTGTIADRRKDRYIAPEMQDWTRIFRSGHFLIFPTSIGKAPVKLFVMDTGAGTNLISPDAAREVTHVSSDDTTRIHGISGDVKNVFGTERISIAFAHVRQDIFGMTAIDTSGLSGFTGVQVSGFIGWTTLKELVISIDYRDNLVHVSYTPHVER